MTELPQWHEDLIRMSTGIDPRAAGAIAGVAGDVARLAGMFNKAQHVPVRGSKMYLSDAALRNAYFIYYTTANMLKLAAPLDALRCSASAAAPAYPAHRPSPLRVQAQVPAPPGLRSPGPPAL